MRTLNTRGLGVLQSSQTAPSHVVAYSRCKAHRTPELNYHEGLVYKLGSTQTKLEFLQGNIITVAVCITFCPLTTISRAFTDCIAIATCPQTTHSHEVRTIQYEVLRLYYRHLPISLHSGAEHGRFCSSGMRSK